MYIKFGQKLLPGKIVLDNPVINVIRIKFVTKLRIKYFLCILCKDDFSRVKTLQQFVHISHITLCYQKLSGRYIDQRYTQKVFCSKMDAGKEIILLDIQHLIPGDDPRSDHLCHCPTDYPAWNRLFHLITDSDTVSCFDKFRQIYIK